jgi:hypothetical protein
MPLRNRDPRYFYGGFCRARTFGRHRLLSFAPASFGARISATLLSENNVGAYASGRREYLDAHGHRPGRSHSSQTKAGLLGNTHPFHVRLLYLRSLVRRTRDTALLFQRRSSSVFFPFGGSRDPAFNAQRDGRLHPWRGAFELEIQPRGILDPFGGLRSPSDEPFDALAGRLAQTHLLPDETSIESDLLTMSTSKIKTWAATALKYLFFMFFLGLLAAILYAAELLRR